MGIKDIRPDLTPTAPLSPVAPVRDDGRSAANRSAGRDTRDADRVEISDEARALAQSEAPERPEGTLEQERLADLCRRVQARYYDAPDVAEDVARRILDSGDL